jgi:hypothetical protein
MGRKMRQNLGGAIGHNSLALPIAAGVFERFGLTLRPEIAAISMSGSSGLVAVHARPRSDGRVCRGERRRLASRSFPIRLDALSAKRWFRDPRAWDRASLTGGAARHRTTS